MTYKQADDRGWQVKKGGKSAVVFFYKPLNVEDEKAKDGHRIVPLLRSFNVFHASQVDGIPAYSPPPLRGAMDAPRGRSDHPEAWRGRCSHRRRQGLLQPGFPPDHAFKASEYWAAVAMHELGHWNGHTSRMNRDLTGSFGSAKYAAEEIRVDMAAAFVCNTLNLPTDHNNHGAYIGEWIKKLKADRREIFHVAADAQKIADWTLKYHPDFASKVEPVGEEATSQPSSVRPSASFAQPLSVPALQG